MAGGYRSTLDQRKLDKSLDELVKQDELSIEREREEKRKSTRYSPYPDPQKSRRQVRREQDSVYVGNLPYILSEDELRHHMSKAGRVTKVTLFEKPGGVSKGCGVVYYYDDVSVKAAIEALNGSELAGRKIIVREDLDPGDRAPKSTSYKPMDSNKIPFNVSVVPSCTVFVDNLDFSVDWAKLKDTFKVAGQVVHVEINKNRDGKSKGNGTVQFKTPLEAINAVSLFHGQMLFNRPMVVRMDKDAPTQVDPSLLKLSMRLDSLVKSGAVHIDPGALPPREEPFHIAHHDRGFTSHGPPPPPSASSAILREKQFQEELADLQRRQRERNEMEIEMLKRRYFGDGGGGGDSFSGPDAGLHHGRESFDKERRLEELRAELYRFDNPLSSLEMMGGSSSQRYDRGRLSPDPMGGHHTSLPPPVVREELLSRHYDMPPSRTMGDIDREPSLLDKVMSERQRGGWRIEEPVPPRFEEPTGSGGRRVFIRNLPWSTTSRHLKNFFNRAIGPVTFAEVMMHTDGRSKGVGVVEFGSSSHAKKAITEYNGKNLGGREVEISEDKYE